MRFFEEFGLSRKAEEAGPTFGNVGGSSSSVTPKGALHTEGNSTPKESQHSAASGSDMAKYIH